MRWLSQCIISQWNNGKLCRQGKIVLCMRTSLHQYDAIISLLDLPRPKFIQSTANAPHHWRQIGVISFPGIGQFPPWRLCFQDINVSLDSKINYSAIITTQRFVCVHHMYFRMSWELIFFEDSFSWKYKMYAFDLIL